MNKHAPKVLVLVCLIFLTPNCGTDVSRPSAPSAPGVATCFDQSFGNCGFVSAAFNGTVNFAQIDPTSGSTGGFLVVGGQEAVATGTACPTTTDGTTGICNSSLPPCNPSVTGSCFTLFRFTTGGVLDTSFGNSGKLQTFLNSGVALQIDGNGDIVVGGSVTVTVGSSNVTTQLVARYVNNGQSLDITNLTPGSPFAGMVNLSALFITQAGDSFSVKDVVLQNSNVSSANITATNPQIVVAGDYTPKGNTAEVGITRLMNNGTIDTTNFAPTTSAIGTGAFANVFGAPFAAGETSRVSRVLVDSATPPNILVVGNSCPGNANPSPACPVVMTRLVNGGTKDGSFPSGGNDEVVTPGNTFGSVFYQGTDILLSEKYGEQGAILRYNSTGGLDTTFGTSGITNTNSTVFGVQPNTENILNLASSGPNASALIQFSSAGALNSSFGTQDLNGIPPKLLTINTSGSALLVYDSGPLNPAPPTTAVLTVIRLTPNQP